MMIPRLVYSLHWPRWRNSKMKMRAPVKTCPRSKSQHLNPFSNYPQQMLERIILTQGWKWKNLVKTLNYLPTMNLSNYHIARIMPAYLVRRWRTLTLNGPKGASEFEWAVP